MNYIDLILAIPLIWGAINGFRKGLIIEVASLVALILGIYGAMEFSFLTADLIRSKVDWSAALIHWISFFLTFVLIVLIVHLIARGIQRIVKLAALGTMNRVIGLIFGLVKYLLVLACLLYLINRVDQRYPFISKTLKEESLLYNPISSIVPRAFPRIEDYLESSEEAVITAFIPGSSTPSRYSIKAPPPVEI